MQSFTELQQQYGETLYLTHYRELGKLFIVLNLTLWDYRIYNSVVPKNNPAQKEQGYPTESNTLINLLTVYFTFLDGFELHINKNQTN